MREIKQIVIHCSATEHYQDIGAEQIRLWHRKRGFRDIGYHYVIRRNGVAEVGRPADQPGAHVKGHNQNTIGICLVGGIGHDGMPTANYTRAQYRTLEVLVDMLKERYRIDDVLGHRDFEGVTKACPCFDVRAYFNEV